MRSFYKILIVIILSLFTFNLYSRTSTYVPLEGEQLANGKIIVGNSSNIATAVDISGDATISNAGVLTISAGALGSSEITDGTIAAVDLDTGMSPYWTGAHVFANSLGIKSGSTTATFSASPAMTSNQTFILPARAGTVALERGPINQVGVYNIGLKAVTTTNNNDSILFRCGNASCSDTNPGYVVTALKPIL